MATADSSRVVNQDSKNLHVEHQSAKYRKIGLTQELTHHAVARRTGPE